MKNLLRIAILGMALAACGGAAATHAPTPAKTAKTAPAAESAFINAARGISIANAPVVPAISQKAKQIYADGIAAGNNPRVFSKVGDCMTDNPHFLAPFAQGKYMLGEYAALEPVIKNYLGVPARTTPNWAQDSFATKSIAAFGGFNVAGPLDATWADPKFCNAGESPLACEYRLAKPGVALLMFGTNDAAATEPEAFVKFYRQMIDETLAKKILPVISTFPTRPENVDKSVLLNQLVLALGKEYDIPVINLNRALEPLPNHGVDAKDTTHLTVPPNDRADDFTPTGLQAGFNVRNLVTLQTLSEVQSSK